MKSTNTKTTAPRLRVWVTEGSFGYWKVVDCDGEALMTAFSDESAARRWVENTVNQGKMELQR